MTTYFCHKCQQLILSDIYQIREQENSRFSFCQPCAGKGIELAGKVYRLCFDSSCPKEKGKERIYLTKKNQTD